MSNIVASITHFFTTVAAVASFLSILFIAILYQANNRMNDNKSTIEPKGKQRTPRFWMTALILSAILVILSGRFLPAAISRRIFMSFSTQANNSNQSISEIKGVTHNFQARRQLSIPGNNNSHHSSNDHQVIISQQTSETTNDHSQVMQSHYEICKSIIVAKESKLIEEVQDICLNEFDPALALAQIFLSAYLAQQGRLHGYGVEYAHKCGRFREEKKVMQEVLPQPLAMPAHQSMPKDDLLQFCRVLVNHADSTHQSNPLKIFLWETNLFQTESQEQISMMERLLPIINENLYEASLQSRFYKSALTAGYGVLKDRDSKSDRIAVGRAVVYIPCRDVHCNDFAVVPYIHFLMHIPLSVHIVDIIICRQCIVNNQGCAKYANDFASTFRQFSPNMSVEVIVANPSSPDIIARLLEAEHVLCASGFGMQCLFPSLARKYGRITLFDLDKNQAGEESASSFVTRLPPSVLSHVNPPISLFAVAFFSSFQGHLDAVTSFSQRPPAKQSGDCRFFRGRFGKWSQNMVYADHAQYRTALRHYSGEADQLFRRKVHQGLHGEMKFRPPTTYRWDELRYDTCGFTQITQQGVCDLMESLSARRIFIVGDSLNLQLAQSLWMWLTNDKFGDSPIARGTFNPNFKAKLLCPVYGEYILQFIRNDELLENDMPVSIDEEKSNCNTYCFKWTEEYKADERRTILIFNAGAHIHEEKQFKNAIDRFINTFDSFQRPQDIVLLRTLIPGHRECGRPGLRPFANFEEYKADAQAQNPDPNEGIYAWDKFQSYNDYSIAALDHRRFAVKDTPQALMEVMDVYPMTILRPDGHISDEYRAPTLLNIDCLHYTLPGPIDWWSHMFFSHLLDIATAENYLALQQKQQQ
mmetsp:Transcript_28541/g.42178  ORF Transcript_28541/g.42178 Transcript_28541/m.42178 type:complete len:870 (+) Transcript_28541:29-2638(+)